MNKFIYIIISIIVILGCSEKDQSQKDQDNFPDIGVFVDYQWATEKESYEIRKDRLQIFLKEHDAVEGDWEDSVHVRYVRYAKYDLLQCFYHLGELNEADNLLKRLVETDAEIK